ncbi:glycoside hydrolase [Sphingomonas ginsenosidivorax]|uniref:Glycoside hydrolase n=1 Tax=Sphingomonas ginsenosidivorax TaxID=862135 RepID=A0A5C6UCE8_9SPHN|nr:glycosyl hydrolase family 28 protein [Sphingomonas ginsenosidivorax]TXC69705.1 glycoside hydrolase [Sphingomonas ginsenosidivorax]
MTYARRDALRLSTAALVGTLAAPLSAASRKTFDARSFGAKGDGRTLDTAAIQRTIDAAAQVGGRVVLGGSARYLTGPLTLAGGIDFHIERHATLCVSTDPAHYADPLAGVLGARGAHGLTLSGAGTIDGRSPAFMERYDAVGEWWIPKPFRPRLVVLADCADLVIRDLTFARAPHWTVHLVGCRRVLIDRLTIANQLDVPNCDGIDPDHCQDVEIRNCRITCGDDAIVIKTTAGYERYGPSRNITVRDCVIETQDSGLKIGTETVQDIHDILFERCEIRRSSRGLCIQLRDAGTVRNIVFRQIRFVAQYFADPWWGRGEAISFTAVPRTASTRIGTIRDVLVEDVTGRAENSIRIEGLNGARVSDIRLRKVHVTLDRWTRYRGGLFDNRPTNVGVALEPHDTVGVNIRHADRVTLDDVTVAVAPRARGQVSDEVRSEDTTALVRR